MAESQAKRSHGWLVVVVVVVVVALSIIAALVWWNFANIQNELYKERAYHLEETSLTQAEKVDTVLNERWDVLSAAEKILDRASYDDTSSLLNALSVADEILPTTNASLVAVDNKRTCYNINAENNIQTWKSTDMLLSDNERQITLEEQSVNSIGTSESMIFLYKLASPIEIGDGSTRVTHIALIESLDTFRSVFYASVYDNKNQTILLNADGTRVYYDINSTMFNNYNVLRSIEGASFMYGGSYEDFLAKFIAGETASAEIHAEDGNYFICSTTLQDGWRYLTIVEEEYVSANSTGFLGSVISSLATLVAVILLITVAAVWLGMSLRSSRRTEELSRRKNQELEVANEAARVAEAKAVSANAAKSDFLSNMSHDIRTPINGIIGMLDIADLHRDNPEEAVAYLDRIRGVTNHLLTLINDVLDMSKAESGKVDLAHEAFDIKELLEECAAIEVGQMRGRELTFKADLDGIRHQYLYGSPLHLRRIYLNILGNAVKYTNDGGHITLTADELIDNDPKMAKIRVIISDDGIGMSKEFQQVIFDPFTRADNSNSSEMRGTGLGMAIVKRLVEIMKGSVTVDSELDRGSTFTVVLPLEINENGAAEAKAAAKESEKQIDISGFKILLVEDNDLNREIAKTLLEERGVIITEAINGEEAVDAFSSNAAGTFDAILMDVMMPVMDGLEATRAIRALSREDAHSIPIIAMTANAFAEDIAATKAAGMNEHLAKPLDFNALVKTLAHYVSR